MTTRLLKGDCLEIMKTLPDKSVDCFICDLPYGLLDTKVGCTWDIKIDLEKFWEQVERLSKNENVPIIHFCNTKFGVELINSKPNWFRYDLVWSKERGVSFQLANKMPMKSHEMIYVFSKKGAYYNRVDIKGEFKPYKAMNSESTTRVVNIGSGRLVSDGNDGTSRCPLSVITIRKPNTKGHPTEKPIDLYKWLIERYCPVNGTVLDPTAGSFNSVEAAVELNRNGIGIELNEEFYQKAVERLNPVNEILPPTSA